jgi:hypothetical protein
MDYYNSYVIHPMLIEVATIMVRHGLLGAKDLTIEQARYSRWAAIQERFISPEGTFPVVGRSITCRFGVLQGLSDAALRGLLPESLSPGQVRSAMTAVLMRFFQGNQNFDSEGWLRIGFNGKQPAVGESYVNTGSLYHCVTGFVCLGLPPNSSFWSSPSEPWTNLRAWTGGDLRGDHALEKSTENRWKRPGQNVHLLQF